MKNFLHVGCGRNNKKRTTREFSTRKWNETRLDIDPSADPDIIASITEMSMVPSGNYSAIFTSHTIEHLYPHDVNAALVEFYRVLNDEGFAIITCPDLRSIARFIAEDQLTDTLYQSAAGPISPLDILFGHRASVARGNHFMAHKTGFTAKTLTKECIDAGFKSVASQSRSRYFDIWLLASKESLPESEISSLALKHFPK